MRPRLPRWNPLDAMIAAAVLWAACGGAMPGVERSAPEVLRAAASGLTTAPAVSVVVDGWEFRVPRGWEAEPIRYIPPGQATAGRPAIIAGYRLVPADPAWAGDAAEDGDADAITIGGPGVRCAALSGFVARCAEGPFPTVHTRSERPEVWLALDRLVERAVPPGA